jgi:hypothetical protein
MHWPLGSGWQQHKIAETSGAAGARPAYARPVGRLRVLDGIEYYFGLEFQTGLRLVPPA